ncbi:MAG: mannonate dehydratase [Alphaproteobacteria bacterium]|nr:mannonate dehydratase [Alphaproteobacteria bacterium]
MPTSIQENRAHGLTQSWRWFGPDDPVTLADIREAGATSVVTALHDAQDGFAWSTDAIAHRRKIIEEAGLNWVVAESIPVHPSIKLGAPDAEMFTEHFCTSMERVAEQGVKTICYNFMPVVDWTRTNVRYEMSSGGLTLRFDAIDFAAYDLYVLKRKGAAAEYSDDVKKQAHERFLQLSDAALHDLEKTVIAGLPGSALSLDRDGISESIAEFDGIDDAALFANLAEFLRKAVPRAEACGARLCVHPDDPPISLFGLPRVVSTAADFRRLLDAAPSNANGITFCTGSLGARRDNDVAAMAAEFADRIHFTHLRNVACEPDGSFIESDHLDGDVDMVAVLDALIKEQHRRRDEGREDWRIPMRPDHGPLLLDDKEKVTNPGYSAIGRLKGLAELRGVMTALEHTLARPRIRTATTA